MYLYMICNTDVNTDLISFDMCKEMKDLLLKPQGALVQRVALVAVLLSVLTHYG